MVGHMLLGDVQMGKLELVSLMTRTDGRIQ